jgi:hypothetical protein
VPDVGVDDQLNDGDVPDKNLLRIPADETVVVAPDQQRRSADAAQLGPGEG